jgi:hypothetical protein
MEFIVYTNTEWDTPPRARHQLAYALAERFKVTFVAGNIMGPPGIKKSQVNENFELLIPYFPCTSRFRYRVPILNEAYQVWLFSKLKTKFSGRDVIIICTEFGGYLIGKYFKKFIYMASDDFINNVNLPAFYTIFTQTRLIKSSTFSLATAITLVNEFSKINPKSYELRLGAQNFPKVDMEKLKLKIPDPNGKIKIVLLGYIDKNTPVELINRILAIDNVELHLIGPIKDDFLDHLSFKERVIHHGVMTGDPLSLKLMEMDVAIVPYYMNEPNTGRTPNKLWQYLATGRPVVMTNLPNVKNWEFPEGTVYKANNYDEFLFYIQKAHKDNSNELIKERVAIAANNSWSVRVDQLLEYIQKYY